MRKYELTLPLDKDALRSKQEELRNKKQDLQPDLERIQQEMDQLNKLRTWTRKVYPEALAQRD